MPSRTAGRPSISPSRPALLLAFTGLLVAGALFTQPRRPADWTVGFWFWSAAPLASPDSETAPVDVIFAHVGNIPSARPEPPGKFSYQLSGLPSAHDYWLVFRYDGNGLPDASVLPGLSEAVTELLRESQERHLHVAGIQLDIEEGEDDLPEIVSDAN